MHHVILILYYYSVYLYCIIVVCMSDTTADGASINPPKALVRHFAASWGARPAVGPRASLPFPRFFFSFFFVYPWYLSYVYDKRRAALSCKVARRRP